MAAPPLRGARLLSAVVALEEEEGEEGGERRLPPRSPPKPRSLRSPPPPAFPSPLLLLPAPPPPPLPLLLVLLLPPKSPSPNRRGVGGDEGGGGGGGAADEEEEEEEKGAAAAAELAGLGSTALLDTCTSPRASLPVHITSISCPALSSSETLWILPCATSEMWSSAWKPPSNSTKAPYSVRPTTLTLYFSPAKTLDPVRLPMPASMARPMDSSRA